MSLPTDHTDQPLAIIGMACRLPGADGLDQFWRLIVNGGSAVSEVPAERFDQGLYYHPQRGQTGKSYSKLAAVLPNRDFDASACPISQELINSVDTTHLLMTGVAADALRHAGLEPFNLAPTNTAVFIGHAQGSSKIGEVTYRTYIDEALELLHETGFSDLPPAEQTAIRREVAQRVHNRLSRPSPNVRNLFCNMVAGTIAKAFKLTGPWLALNSACASSLHAMLLGARALQCGRAEMAIVGGASDCKSDSLVLFSAAQTLSPCGSKPFDAEADGLVMSEGYVALVMKTLERALADGDPIQAVVRGLGVASDGRGKSLWAPRKEGQMKAMQRAYRSGVDMAGLQYLEAHATSTQVGDATELETLGEVLGPKLPAGKKIPISSVKANIGHALEAAGVAGVIKTVLCMQHQTFPPAINVSSLNPKVNWSSAPYYIPLEPAPWETPADGGPRRAAVNAFGIGGLNMHVVLDEFNPSTARQSLNGARPAAVSADDRAVAVVGMSCLLPGALGLEKFWNVLVGRVDPKTAPTPQRWTRKALAEQSSRPAVGGFINDFQYDWRKRKVPPKQVAEADPLQFMLLEAAEQALLDAGYDSKQIDREKCGVIVGTEFGGEFCDSVEIGLRLPEMQKFLGEILRRRGVTPERVEAINGAFGKALLRKWPSLLDETGSFTTSTLASRITKTLDLAGGAVAIDSGATSGLSALALCVDLLHSGDNDMMICAAGQRRMGSCAFDALDRAGLLAGSIPPRNVLDSGYDGVVPGEGVAVVILKRLSDARRDGDRIHAIIRGLGIAHHDTNGEALRLAAERAHAMAGVDASQVNLAEVETDERLSPDGEELEALVAAHEPAKRQQPLVVGSLTAQFGHLGAASAIASLLKASLELGHGKSVPALGLNTPAAALDGGATRASIASEKLSGRLGAIACWSRNQACYLLLEVPASAASKATPVTAVASPATAQSPRIKVAARQPMAKAAAPSSAAQPARATVAPSASEWRICRFGGSSLDQVHSSLHSASADPAVAWRGAATGRFGAQQRARLAIVADGPETLARKLQLARPQLHNPAARVVLQQQGIFYHETLAARPRVAFVFPGQGSQYDGMLHQLAHDSPAAAAALAECDEAMARLGYPSLAKLAWEAPTQLGSDVWTTQVSMLLADAIALAAIRAIGIVPDLVLGHSYGEFVALYAAGAWGLDTAIRTTRARCDGILAVASSGGGMLATNAPPHMIETLANDISGVLYIANFNAPDQSVVGGKRPQLEALAKALEARQHQARMLAVPAAFHTPLMAGASRLLEQQLQSARLLPLSVPMISTVTNAPVSDVEQIRRNLAAQMTTPVRYSQLIAQLAAERPTVFVEVGPAQTMTRLNRRILGNEAAVIACDNPKRPGLEPLVCVQALLECHGAFPHQAPASRFAMRVPAHLGANRLIPTSASKESNGTTMRDEIPHFDATERRRAKMRAGSSGTAGSTASGDKPPASPPAPKSPAKTPSAAPAASRGHAAAPAAAKPRPAMAQPQRPSTPATRPVTSSPAPRPAAGSSSTAVKPAPAPRPATAPPVASAAVAPASTPRNGRSAHHEPIVTKSASATATAAGRPAPAELESFLINFVVEQTGYPAEVVELDADLEADLGIDSIKKAQLFGELQEYFDVGATSTNLSLDDFPTLRHVLNFLQTLDTQAPAASASAKPQEVAAPIAPSVPPAAQAAPSTAPAVSTAADDRPSGANLQSIEELESFLINFVVEQTGYPAEVVELDADLEADLGIDSIKKAQLFGELQEYFDVGTTATNLSLDDFPTLRHVLNFLAEAGSATGHTSATEIPIVAAHAAPESPTSATVQAPATASPAQSVRSNAAPSANEAELASFLINFVVEQTGYPAEVVELDADLEADLGIDSIKKAQLFGELQEYFDVATAATNLSLDDFPTLRHVLNFLLEASSGAPANAAAAQDAQHSSATADPAPAVANELHSAPAVDPERSLAADAEGLESFLINFVVEQTGYPAEVVELDADLEADLGIDSIKKAQLFGELQEYFDVGTTATNLSLDDFPTLRHVLDFLLASGAGQAAASTAPADDLPVQHGQAAYSNGYAAAAPVAAQIPQPAPTEHPGGTHYDRGFERGKRCKLQIMRILRDHAERAGSEAPERQALTAVTTSHELLSPEEIDELEGMADAIQVPLGNLLANHFALRELDETVDRTTTSAPVSDASPTTTGAPESGEAPAIELPPGAVTSRFELEMREAPISGNVPAEPTWTGPAIVVGSDPVADRLHARLERSGVKVHRLPLGDTDQALAELERICHSGPAPHLFITSGRDATLAEAYDEQFWSRRRRESMVLPFFVCQKWIQLATSGHWLDRATLVTVPNLGGDFGFQRGAEAAAGGALAGLAKAIFIEYTIMQGLRDFRVKAIDAPTAAAPEQVVDGIFRELASGKLDYEVAFVDGKRLIPCAIEREVQGANRWGIRPGAVWVVTGGARGITAACAMELGRRFGLKLHLLGTTLRPQIDPAHRGLTGEALQQLKASVMIAARKAGDSAAGAWERFQKDLEIDRSLEAFAAAGIDATYHECDVADRAAVEQTLERIRETDGPIEGILHGAGIDRSCRFDRKQRDVVLKTIGAKVDGAANLMATTRRDPVRHFIGFGSISGRLGSLGQADYCLASDMLSKLIGSYRRQRPWVQAVAFHWHPWDEVGMAARPETKNVLQGKSDLTLMPLAEGIAHLLRELAAGSPKHEVLITERRHWQRYEQGLDKLIVKTPAGPTDRKRETAEPVATPKTAQAAQGETPVELQTHRCQLHTRFAPLPPDSPSVPALDGHAWILGDNEAAAALAERLNEIGCRARMVPLRDDLDQTLAEVDRLWARQPAKHLFLMTGRDPLAGDLLDESVMRQRRDRGILLPFYVAQRWYKLLASRPDLGTGHLVAAVSLGGDFGFSGRAVAPEGGAMAGLLKAVYIEIARRPESRVRAKVIDAPADEQPRVLVDAMLRELAASEPEVEVCWSRGTRRAVRPIAVPLASPKAGSIPRGGTWVVTGGGRGITAIAARELARRYGSKLHLIGKSPAPVVDAAWRGYSEAQMKELKTTLARTAVAEGRSPSEAWDRVMKDVEIFNNLKAFADAGLQATYHACDITDRSALATVLDEVRRQDGPIQGILHGAGVIDPSRFETKRRSIVSALVGAKFDGTLNLMALTARDPLGFFVGFGSISGRFGANGLTDYAAGNDCLAKTIDWFRTVRPECRSTCIHWESWEGSGMATQPRFSFGPKAIMHMKYMQPEEGVARLDEELQAGLPDSEVLYTFGEFYSMFYPDERPLADDEPGLPPVAVAANAKLQLPLIGKTQRDEGVLVAELLLDPIADSFLVQHRLRGKPLFPVVVGLEALAEAARSATGRQVVGFHNVQMLDGLVFHGNRPQLALVSSTTAADGTQECKLTCDFRNRGGGLIQKDRPYLRANLEVTDAPLVLTARLPAAPEAWTPFAYPEDAPIFHGPAFRGVTAISCHEKSGWGRIGPLRLADLVGASRVPGWTVPSCVLDAAMYACGIHVWMRGNGAVSLPKAIDHLRLGRALRDGETSLVHFTCHQITSDAACYDFTVLGEDRAVLIEARGYRKVIFVRGGAQ